jgi:hypothetical protein
MSWHSTRCRSTSWRSTRCRSTSCRSTSCRSTTCRSTRGMCKNKLCTNAIHNALFKIQNYNFPMPTATFKLPLYLFPERSQFYPGK